MDSWKAEVYAPADPIPRYWRKRVWRVMDRDKYACLACRAVDHLTVHHIIPRDEGGKDSLHNLVTLCAKCHDAIEPVWSRFRTRKDIRDAFLPGADPEPKPDPDPSDWRTWVYGGSRRPGT